MANYAHITNSVVDNVIIADTDFINRLENVSEYVEIPNESIGIGFNYNGSVFYPPQPFPSWILDSNFVWQPPTAKPNDGQNYRWDEINQQWVVFVPRIKQPTHNEP